VFSSAIAVGIALALGCNDEIIVLTLLTMAVTIPVSLFVPFDASFRAKDRMDVASFANIVGKTVTLVATAIALRFGSGLTEIILMLGVGNIATLMVAVIAARRLDIAVKAPAIKALRELFRRGAPIAAHSLVTASQPFLEILLLSALAGPVVVGWYGAFRSIFGVVVSQAVILTAAVFPELSRRSLSLPDLRRTVDATGRVLLTAAAFASSALYLFANDIVAIIYGHGRFEQTASILRVGAIFVPLLFFSYLLSSVLFAVGRNKALFVLNTVRVALYVAVSWLFIGFWQQQDGNGAIALVIIAGLTEIPATIAYLILLPSGAVGSSMAFNVVRSHIAALCTAVPLSLLQPIGIWYLTPLFALLFVAAAIITRLILPRDMWLAMEVARSSVFMATKSAPGRS
jgi:O-antigen/teichoic acid export membrane protein